MASRRRTGAGAGRPRRRMWAALAAVLVLGAVTAGVVVERGSAVAEEPAPPFSPTIGSCLGSVPVSDEPILADDVVACDTTHAAQVYARFRPSPPTAEEAASAASAPRGFHGLASQGCLRRFAPFVGAGYASSSLDYVAVTGPPESSDGWVTCAVHQTDGSPPPRTFRDSAR